MLDLFSNASNFTVAWSIIDFLNNGGSLFNKIAAAVITIIGSVLILFGGFQLFKAITSQQGAGGHYLKAALGVFVGGALVFGGWNMIGNIAKGGKSTIEELGKGATISYVETSNHLQQYYVDPNKVYLKS